MIYYAYKSTPTGTLLLTREQEALTGLYWKVFRHTPAPQPSWVNDDAAFSDVFAQLEQYNHGERNVFAVPIAIKGTPFQMEVWQQLKKIPYGTSSTYQAIAQQIGRPKAARAVGTAIGNNPVCIIIPCHRVLTTAGTLGGYAGGAAAKIQLLATENISYK